MSLNSKMLIIVNMECLTENALGSGITLQLGNLENYVKRIVVTSGIINIETAQRLPSGTKENWGDNPIIHKQEDLYKIPSELI